MNSVFSLIGFIAQLVSIYSMLCFVRIILSWIPQFSYSKVAQILGKICDPYLNIFRKLPLHIANLDFSPIIAFIILSGISTILQYIATLQKISLGIILAITLQMIWSAISSILLLFIIILAVRLVVQRIHTVGKVGIGFVRQIRTRIKRRRKVFFRNVNL